jgi:hypothetical protein
MAPVDPPLRRGGIVGARSVYRGGPFGPSRHNQKSLNQHQASRYGTDESVNFGIGGAITIQLLRLPGILQPGQRRQQ